MKRMFRILFAVLALSLLLPAVSLAEKILWADENGRVIMDDDGSIDFLPPEPGSVWEEPEPEGGWVIEETFTPVPAGTPSPDAQAHPADRDSFMTPLPTPTPEPFTYTRKLEYGDNGDLVARLQSRLLELGFYEARISGGYYKITRNAVRAFQAHNGLSVDGVAGRQTQELLFSADARSILDAPRPSPTPAPPQYTLMVDVANQITRAYTYDENGEYTILVREMICSTGTSRNPTPLGTTIMPQKRARWGYFPTWDSHAQYLTRIDAANAFHSVLYTEADERTLAVSSFEDLGSPASHGCVRLYVSDAKWIYDNCRAGTIVTVYEGEYDPEYTMTLRRSLNTETLRERALPEPTPTPHYCEENWPTRYRTLYRGRSGEDVFMLQMRLAELGYYNGTITGGYWGGTIEAVKAFQRDHGLTVDGAAGEKTQAVLFARKATPSPDAALPQAGAEAPHAAEAGTGSGSENGAGSGDEFGSGFGSDGEADAGIDGMNDIEIENTPFVPFAETVG